MNEVVKESLRIRYYAPMYRRHEDVLQLLQHIKEEHAIDYEVVGLRKDNDYADEEKQKKVYKRDFLPRARVLKKRVGSGLRDNLRGSNPPHHYHLSGTIAVTKDGRIEWYASYTDEKYEEMKSYDENYRIGFLKMILEKRSPLLEQICAGDEISKEEEIYHQFRKQGEINGSFSPYDTVEVGKERAKRLIKKQRPKTLSGAMSALTKTKTGKRIDGVCKTEDTAWVLEVKEKLNEKALGQVLVYKDLYAEEHPEMEVKTGIVCEKVDRMLIPTFKKHNVEVFRVSLE